MANYQILLLITVFSINMAFSCCQILTDKTSKYSNEVGLMTWNEVYRSIPTDFPIENTIIKLKEIVGKMDRERFEFNNISFPMVRKVVDVLIDKYGSKKEIFEIISHGEQIDQMRGNFNNFIGSLKKFSDLTKVDKFFLEILHPLENISSTLESMETVLIGNNSNPSNWFQFLGDYARDFKGSVCDEKRLIQGHIFNFYNFVFDMEYTTSLLLFTVHHHLIRRNLGIDKKDIQKVLKDSEIRLRKYAEKASVAMRNTPRDIYSCDDEEDQTYTALQGFSQGFLINSNQLDGHSCQSNKVTANACSNDKADCLGFTCAGNLTDCRDITEGMETTNTLYVCEADYDSKRYEWALFDDKPFGGFTSKDECEASILPYPMKVDGKQSHMCYCNCERTDWNSADVRAISLTEVKSDYNKNRVITDIKFEETDGMIHLRVQEGKVLPGGKIDRSTLSWIKTPKLLPILKNNSKIPYYYVFEDHNRLSSRWLPQRDFEYISKNLYINFDDVTALENHVVIGVALMRRDARGTLPYDELELRISTIEYNYVLGTLVQPDKIFYVTSSIKNRKTLNLGSPGSPTRSFKLNNVLSNPNENVLFQRSDVKNDLGQSIVPFFDTRPLNPVISTPLSGIGIYHRGCENSGGFISLKIISSDVSGFLTRK